MTLKLKSANQFQKDIEAGIFLPIGNGGWIMSTNSPNTPGTYEHNRDVTIQAEELGYDVALSMAAWTGYDGPAEHWSRLLESLSMMSGLAEATSRIQVWATVQVMAWHPLVVAKIIATLDQISVGRAGLNVVTGNMPRELAQVERWGPLDHDGKYELAEEWVQVARKYWTEDRLYHKGKYFEVDGAKCSPKPHTMPRIVCAGQSPSGFKFTAENCDYAFFVGSDSERELERMKLAKTIAAEAGNKALKTFGLFTLVPAETDEEAEARVAYFNEGTDLEVLHQFVAYYGDDPKNEARKHWVRQIEQRQSLMDGYMAGSYETLARRLATAVQHGDLDGIMLVVPDFIKDVEVVSKRVFPLLVEYGIQSNVARAAKAR